MGEAKEWLFEPSFNRAVKVCASDERITSDAGFLLLREADQRIDDQLAAASRRDRLRAHSWRTANPFAFSISSSPRGPARCRLPTATKYGSRAFR